MLTDGRLRLLNCLSPEHKWVTINETMRAFILKDGVWVLFCTQKQQGITNCLSNDVVEVDAKNENAFLSKVAKLRGYKSVKSLLEQYNAA
ncbi:hypothetical protein [Photobacterium sp. GB-72]|uniref:hypothetical protein n=1 Tax=Photobacterium sp. GB-72 TaxID=2022105 RepID=UPI000D174226|nr:hypothetical protein [Photobacterium sp. GB-72]PSV26267.1 hypothetical protein C9J40_21535 [Photobacterium sp. GB-72]